MIVQRIRAVLLAGSIVLFQAPALSGQAAQERDPDVAAGLAEARALLAREHYVRPPEAVARLVTADRSRIVSLDNVSPAGTHFLRETRKGAPRVTEYGKAHLYFAGLQVDPAAHRARTLTTRGAAGLEIIDAATGAVTPVAVPAGATVSSPVWSPDGRRIAFIANYATASQVYVAEVATGRARQVTRSPLLATLVTTVAWTAGGTQIAAVLVPEGRGAPPARPAIATGPLVRLWMDSVKSAERNWASLLDDPADQAMLEYHVTGQLALIDVATRTITPVGKPAMIERVDAAPDGRYLRVTTMTTPFSYVVPIADFGEREAIWDTQGRELAEVRTRPVRSGNDSTRGRGDDADGARRGLAWMPRSEGLYYIASDSVRSRGDSTAGAAANGNGRGGRGAGQNRPARVIHWMPPFGPNDTTTVYRAEGPVASAVFSEDETTLFVASTRNGTGEIVAVTLAEPTQQHVIVRQREYTPTFTGTTTGFGGFGGRTGSPGDSISFYTNPGSMMTTTGIQGGRVAMVSSDGAVFLTGIAYHRNWEKDAPRTFVDKVTITSGAKTRIFEGDTNAWETILPLDRDFQRAVVTRESPTEVPNAFFRDFTTGSRTPLTKNEDPTPTFTQAVRKRLWVTRSDGIRFVVDLTLPAEYQAGTRLPGMLWFYPYEYTNQGEYDRTLRRENINRFPASNPRTIEFLVTQGYAVANFDPPIIGETGRMNDNYVSDLQRNLIAVIDELDRQGYIDRTRLGIGGHSYGAFSTANAMVHTPYFKAGIAGDGMYNRTLTPTGFQSERRDLWSGQKTYLDMSPMLEADKLQGALLMYHGLEDQNVGTAPISSIRMMQALRAYGKVAALYMYPYEDHGPATEETVLDLWGRWTAWLDLYVKHAGMAIPKTPAVAVEANATPN